MGEPSERPCSLSRRTSHRVMARAPALPRAHAPALPPAPAPAPAQFASPPASPSRGQRVDPALSSPVAHDHSPPRHRHSKVFAIPRTRRAPSSTADGFSHVPPRCSQHGTTAPIAHPSPSAEHGPLGSVVIAGELALPAPQYHRVVSPQRAVHTRLGNAAFGSRLGNFVSIGQGGALVHGRGSVFSSSLHATPIAIASAAPPASARFITRSGSTRTASPCRSWRLACAAVCSRSLRGRRARWDCR